MTDTGPRHSRPQESPLNPIIPHCLQLTTHSPEACSPQSRRRRPAGSHNPNLSHTDQNEGTRDITSHMEGARRRSKRDADPFCRFSSYVLPVAHHPAPGARICVRPIRDQIVAPGGCSPYSSELFKTNVLANAELKLLILVILVHQVQPRMV
ncbi:hypothetical protein BDP55DRAFT_636262 [Colletotrichum godetiae]|uniref:Uncharacterized protein n=1 Tax=Colletotrichum godetiae TaxID=1209918 RepID=A0AAJ0ABV2_9PEZI|nr:uncharacterized protein BDP55DRAFT_636262 [Colletotrichum godetiae]KAK1671043.1 hypothetical protein BDP55DRAFT_636262 [Colletotrichum godetiae]